MLPNHAPLVVAEQFGTLASLYPGRIDLGLGRAQELISGLLPCAEISPGVPTIFPACGGTPALSERGQRGAGGDRHAGAGTNVPLWILGSSLFSAQLAAALGLPYAFASHFTPQDMMQAIAIYRERFKPSKQLQKPLVMLGYNVFVADTDEEALYLRSSALQSMLSLRRETRYSCRHRWRVEQA